MTENRTNSHWLTTGQAAKLCSVTPDTVLKWIRKGRLDAARTAGGHFRIRREALDGLIRDGQTTERDSASSDAHFSVPLRCWEYLSDGGVVRDACRDCIVHRVRASWCFRMAVLAPEIGHAGGCCQTSCEDCAYYRRVCGLPTNVLVVTSDLDLVRGLRDGEHEGLTIRFADNAYDAAALVQGFLPAVALVDQETCGDGSGGLVQSLASDPRLPGLKIVEAVPPGGQGCLGDGEDAHYVVEVLEKPLGPRDIAAVVDSYPVEVMDTGDTEVWRHPEREVAMIMERGTATAARDHDGFLKELSSWSRATAEALAEEHGIGPLTEEHWRIIEFVQEYYQAYGKGPPVVKVHKETGLRSEEICKLFPCGMVKGAYRLAGLPRPPGCV
jgi:tRNA 2-thiouridine synthesizing protein E